MRTLWDLIKIFAEELPGLVLALVVVPVIFMSVTLLHWINGRSLKADPENVIGLTIIGSIFAYVLIGHFLGIVKEPSSDSTSSKTNTPNTVGKTTNQGGNDNAAYHDEYLKDFSGKIIGRITTKSNGEQTIRDFNGKILGTYDGTYTRDFNGKILSQGNTLARLI